MRFKAKLRVQMYLPHIAKVALTELTRKYQILAVDRGLNARSLAHWGDR